MLIDYKFWYIKRDDNGFITEAAIRFYTGNISTQSELQPDGTSLLITRYRRATKLTQNVIQTALNKFGIQIILDAANNPVVILTPSQFGQITTDEQLRTYCNTVLAKFGITPIQEQT